MIFDFEEILKNDSALTNLSFSTLLSHRWEFQPGACLNDDECKYVTALKTCLNIHKSEP